MLVEKEVIRPGTYWYRDMTTGIPRKLVVTPELTKYWHDQGNAMLSTGLTIPVPFEHDFGANPMTPADLLKSNAGWVKELRLSDGRGGRGDRLHGVVDVLDEEVAKKLPGTIRWSSPWFNSFTDGKGKEWKNVISHLALTTRPRIVEQAPFGSIAAALSLATPVNHDLAAMLALPELHDGGAGFCLTNAARLAVRKRDKKLAPRYPVAFSLFSGAALGAGDFPPPKSKDKRPGLNKKKDAKVDDDLAEDEFEGEEDEAPDDGDSTNDDDIDLEPFGDPAGDVSMTELLCDLLGALGISVKSSGNEEMFKRELYNAAMTKIHELTAKGQADGKDPNRTNPPGQPPNNPKPGAPGQPNPLIQQEQQPMYMSLEDINKITDSTMRTIALSMYNENVKIRAEAEADRKKLASLNDAKLKEENTKRASRVALLSRLSPKVKTDLDAMLALPAMALSMGDGGTVVDPMAQTLAVLEKGLADLPRLLTVEQSALSVQPQPQDADMLTQERADEIADTMARAMGCPPVAKAG